jgi:hypothetical protein
MTIALEDDDTLDELVNELGRYLEEGWALNQIDIYRAAKPAPIKLAPPNITTIYNDASRRPQ